MSSEPSAKAVELVNEYFYSVVCDEQQRARLLKYDAPAMKAAHAALLAHIADLERRVGEAEAVLGEIVEGGFTNYPADERACFFCWGLPEHDAGVCPWERARDLLMRAGRKGAAK